MIHVILVFFVLIALLLIFWFSVILGRYFGREQIKHHVTHKLEVISVAEGAVFGLLGLLIAFTFSGAYDRYETRKSHILEEANIFDTAYEMIDLVPLKYQAGLRQNVREYLDLHIASYQHIPYVTKVLADLDKAIVVQHQIWKTVVDANEENPNNGLTQLVIPAMSKMFETFHSGINMTLIHPPLIIFLLLIGLASIGAFLIGYNSIENEQKYPVHLLCYVALTAFIIYLIFNLEYPRVGFIRLNSFDQMLIDVREDMNYVPPSVLSRSTSVSKGTD